jgi:hypothetical protein
LCDDSMQLRRAASSCLRCITTERDDPMQDDEGLRRVVSLCLQCITTEREVWVHFLVAHHRSILFTTSSTIQSHVASHPQHDHQCGKKHGKPPTKKK